MFVLSKGDSSLLELKYQHSSLFHRNMPAGHGTLNESLMAEVKILEILASQT
jgi:hypothetical protein